MTIMMKTKVWMLAILFISLLVVSCEEEEEVNEAQVLIEWLEDATSPAADYGNGSLAIHSAEHVSDMLAADKIYVIDIRSAEDYADGHIDGAVNLTAGAVRGHIDATDLSAYDEISIVCYTGQTASWLTCLLRLAGYDNVYSMKFGMSSWHADFDKWTANCNSEKSTFFTTDATEKAAAGNLPDLGTGKETAEEIFDARWDIVLGEGFGEAAISNADVYANLSNYYIINYWPKTEYETVGHIEGAIQYTPSTDLKLDEALKTLPTDKTVVVYCYTGQNSARVAAYLRVIGYDAKSLKFGTNGMIYDDMIKSQWSDGAIMNYDYVTSK